MSDVEGADKQDSRGTAHLELCIGPDNRVRFYPSGDAAQIEAALRRLVRLFSESPALIACAAGTCADHRRAS